MSAAVKVPHVHAVKIHAFADGFDIDWSNNPDGPWVHCHRAPQWVEGHYYRVKPAPPARIYPVTGMTGKECRNVFNAAPDDNDSDHWLSIANAALAHAVDANEILTLADHQATITAFGEKLRDAASGREMAIAEAVRGGCGKICDSYSFAAQRKVDSLNLAAIIAKVPTC